MDIQDFQKKYGIEGAAIEDVLRKLEAYSGQLDELIAQNDKLRDENRDLAAKHHRQYMAHQKVSKLLHGFLEGTKANR